MKFSMSTFAIILGLIFARSPMAKASIFRANQGASFTLPAQGDREAAQVYLPLQFSNRRNWPVVVLLHGYIGNSTSIESYFGFSKYTSARGFILVVPNGLKDHDARRYWNATPACCDFDHAKPDDAGYLKDLIHQIVSVYHGDPQRISLAGHSNGGFMSHRLACEPDLKVAALVSFAGESFLDSKDCRSKNPTAVLQMQALDDDTIFYLGSSGYPGLAPYPSAIQTVAFWRAQNGCTGETSAPERLNLTLSISDFDTTASAWTHCRAGADVELWTIDAHQGAFHFPHTPLLRDEFTIRALDFLFRHESE